MTITGELPANVRHDGAQVRSVLGRALTVGPSQIICQDGPQEPSRVLVSLCVIAQGVLEFYRTFFSGIEHTQSPFAAEK